MILSERDPLVVSIGGLLSVEVQCGESCLPTGLEPREKEEQFDWQNVGRGMQTGDAAGRQAGRHWARTGRKPDFDEGVELTRRPLAGDPTWSPRSPATRGQEDRPV